MRVLAGSCCKRLCHLKCSNLSHTAQKTFVARCRWKCDSYVDSQTRSTSNTYLPTSRSKRCLRQSLQLLQWNCCGAQSKQAEIVDALRDNNIDVACIQETKLRDNDKTPKFSVYTSIRQDRTNRAVAGGGLLTLVKDNLPFQRQHAATEGNVWQVHKTKAAGLLLNFS